MTPGPRAFIAPEAGHPGSPDPGRIEGPGRWAASETAWLSGVIAASFAAGALRAGVEPLHLLVLGYWVSLYSSLRLFGASGARLVDVRTLPLTLSCGVALGWERPDLLSAILGCTLLAVIARGVIALTGQGERTRRAVAALPSSALMFLAYLAGYPPDGTIAVGRWGAAVAAVAVTAVVVGSALTPLRTGHSPWPSVAYHLGWAGLWAALTLRSAPSLTFPPGLPHRSSAALCALFATLAALRSPVASRVPQGVRAAAEVAAAVALLAVVARWP